MTDSRRAVGFTLIELLVVIAIIAILAAIIFPVFTQAREKARAIACVSNEKQISLALLQYNQDYDEAFPFGIYLDGAGNGWVWNQVLQPYIKNGQANAGGDLTGGVWNCPSNPFPFQDFQYGANLNLVWDHRVNPTFPPALLSEIDSPGDKIWLVEKGSNDGNASWAFFDANEWEWINGPVMTAPGGVSATYLPSGDGMDLALTAGDCDLPANKNAAPTWANFDDGGAKADCSSLPRFRHNDTCNVAFVDGHVKAMHKGGIKWYKNIYVDTGYSQANADWYPY